jgi:hypothetical protein
VGFTTAARPSNKTSGFIGFNADPDPGQALMSQKVEYPVAVAGTYLNPGLLHSSRTF